MAFICDDPAFTTRVKPALSCARIRLVGFQKQKELTVEGAFMMYAKLTVECLELPGRRFEIIACFIYDIDRWSENAVVPIAFPYELRPDLFALISTLDPYQKDFACPADK